MHCRHVSRSRNWLPTQSVPEQQPDLSLYRNRTLRHTENANRLAKDKQYSKILRHNRNNASLEPHRAPTEYVSELELNRDCYAPNPHDHRTIKGKCRSALQVDQSYDIDGDGTVSIDDYAIAKQIDKEKNGKLNNEQKYQSQKALATKLWRDKQTYAFNSESPIGTPRIEDQVDKMLSSADRFPQEYQQQKYLHQLSQLKHSNKIQKEIRTPYQCDEHRLHKNELHIGANSRSQLLEQRRLRDSKLAHDRFANSAYGQDFHMGRTTSIRNETFVKIAQRHMSGQEAIEKLTRIISAPIVPL